MTGAVKQEGRLKDTVLAGLVTGALLLSASGSALAAGKMGGAGGMDRSAYATSIDEAGEEAADDERSEATDDPVDLGGKSRVDDFSPPVRLGGKAGVGEFSGTVPLGSKIGIEPDKTDASGAV